MHPFEDCARPDGGFAGAPGGDYRPDATAWAILALGALGLGGGDAARRRLADGQLADGRVPIAPEHPDSDWPTALAALAWHGAPDYAAPATRALDYLRVSEGRRFVRGTLPVGHDTTLRAWSWTRGAAPWVEPTAMAVHALALDRRADDPRLGEGVASLLDRALRSGGWNYGNTTVFGHELRPMVHDTGLALSSLAGLVEHARVAASLDWLEQRLATVSSPLALGWGALALGAWGAWPSDIDARLERCLEPRGPAALDLTHRALVIVARHAPRGLRSLLRGER